MRSLVEQYVGELAQNPLDIAGDVKCPVLAFYGGQDKSIPQETVEKREETCKAAGKTCEFKVTKRPLQHGKLDGGGIQMNIPAAKSIARLVAKWVCRHGVSRAITITHEDDVFSRTEIDRLPPI